jgi:hypothetical protein
VNPAVKLPPGAVSVDKLDLLNYDSEKAGVEREAALTRWQNEVL